MEAADSLAARAVKPHHFSATSASAPSGTPFLILASTKPLARANLGSTQTLSRSAHSFVAARLRALSAFGADFGRPLRSNKST